MLVLRPVEAKEQLEKAVDRAAKAIAEGRDAMRGLRASTVETNDLAGAINTMGEELARAPDNQGTPAFHFTAEGSHESCIRFCAMKSTGLPLRRSGTPSPCRARKSKLKPYDGQ